MCLSTISPVNNESSKNGRGYEELLYGTVIIIARVSRGIRCRGRILNDRGSDQFMGYEVVGSNRRVWEKSRIIVKRDRNSMVNRSLGIERM